MIIKTADGVDISLNHYKNGHSAVLIICHGWFMSKDSKAFAAMAEDFAKYFDVITFDFRGHCESGGKYTFGAEELNDLKAVSGYASGYEKKYLIGFSLGALTAIEYCATYKDIAALIAVSAPVSFKNIENKVWKPEAFIPTLKKFELKRWISVRFSRWWRKKTSPVKIIQNVAPTPILLIAGEKDPIISARHNEILYKKAVEPKSKALIKNGKHAEDLYLEHREEFLKTCLNWLIQPNGSS